MIQFKNISFQCAEQGFGFLPDFFVFEMYVRFGRNTAADAYGISVIVVDGRPYDNV